MMKGQSLRTRRLRLDKEIWSYDAAMKISSRVTASIDVSIKKDSMEVTKKTPEDGVVAANEEPASKKDPKFLKYLHLHSRGYI